MIYVQCGGNKIAQVFKMKRSRHGDPAIDLSPTDIYKALSDHDCDHTKKPRYKMSKAITIMQYKMYFQVSSSASINHHLIFIREFSDDTVLPRHCSLPQREELPAVATTVVLRIQLEIRHHRSDLLANLSRKRKSLRYADGHNCAIH